MKRLALLPSFFLLAACSSHLPGGPEEPGLSVVETTPGQSQLNYMLASGNYSCERGARLAMQRHAHNQKHISINWNGGKYDLRRDPASSSGLPRYESDNNELVWIELPWKGVLLDGKTHKPLANECTTT